MMMNTKEKEEAARDSTPATVADVETSDSLVFNPPVYLQRYGTVTHVLNEEKWRNKITKVVDFGCAEFKLFKFLKSLPHIQHIFGVDVDESLMNRCKYEAKPMIHDHLNSYSRKLTVDLLVGSIAEPDSRIIGVDAVICIELIEHLYPETLERVPFTVFECVRPKLAIFTTPNSDFNVLLKLEKFRHPDHKFEWSRQEFEEWCLQIVRKYDEYEVYFEGIGEGPEGTQHLGCVSQMAVFTRLESSDVNSKPSLVTETPYKLFERIEYPFSKDERSDEQKLIDEIKYCVHKVLINDLFFLDYVTDDGYNYEIPVSYLLEHVTNFCDNNVEILKNTLEIMGYKITFNENGDEIIKETDDSGERSCSDDFDYGSDDCDSTCVYDTVHVEEKWD